MCISALSTRNLTFSVVTIGVRHARVCYVGVGRTRGLLISMKIGSHNTLRLLPVHCGWARSHKCVDKVYGFAAVSVARTARGGDLCCGESTRVRCWRVEVCRS